MVKGVPELRLGEARDAMMAWYAVGLAICVHFELGCLETVNCCLQEVVTRPCVQREGVGASEGHCAIVAIVCCLLLCTICSCLCDGGELPFRERFASVDPKTLVGSGGAGQLDTSGSTSIHKSPVTIARETTAAP